MKIKCIANDINCMLKKNLYPSTELNVKSVSGNDQMFITVDREYNVYAISAFNDCMWYFIAEDIFGQGRNYPFWYPAELFEIIEHKISSTWVVNAIKELDGNLRPIITFSEWANNDEYYESLVDGDKEAYEIFMKYKKIMDNEFK